MTTTSTAKSTLTRDSSARGDSIFKGLSTFSGTLILVILALVAAFLIWQAVPALPASEQSLKSAGVDAPNFWSYVGPFAFGTLWSSILALLLSVPVSIGIALFISHYAPRKLASVIGYIVDLLAAVPSVVFGLWGMKTLSGIVTPVYDFLNRTIGQVPFFNWFFGGNATATGRTILTASLVLAVMVLPIITSISREIFLQTPKLHEEASLALGATRWEMIQQAVLPFARSGIVSACMLGLGRALGETMAVAMVLSGSGAVTFELLTSQNPNTIAANIALNFPEAFGLKANVLIATGLILFAITLVVNMIARAITTPKN